MFALNVLFKVVLSMEIGVFLALISIMSFDHFSLLS
jgi:hypothetical protein